MTTTLLKKQINELIGDINDKDFLQAVYTIVSNKADEVNPELSPDLKNELDQRKENHLKGISNSYSWQSVKKAALSRKS